MTRPGPTGGAGLMLESHLRVSDLVEAARVAEAAGYSDLWVTSTAFEHDCYMVLGAIAERTSRIRLGPGVSDWHTRHPLSLAMAAATLDEVSEGRAMLGLGAGLAVRTALGVERWRPLRELREAVDLTRLLLSGAPVDYTGEIFSIHQGQLGGELRHADVPIYIATHGEQVLRLSGRIADGVLMANFATRSAVDYALDLVRAGEQAAGRDPGTVRANLRLELCLSNDEDQAMGVMRTRLARRLIATYPHWDYLAHLDLTPTETLRSAAAASDVSAVERSLDATAVRSTGLVGSVDSIVAQLRAIAGAQFDQLTIKPYPAPGLSETEMASRFARDVWPAVVDSCVSSERIVRKD